MDNNDFWEERYRAGAKQRYPWSQVVSFIMRHRNKTKAPEDTKIIEIGCGTGSNLWFAAREGFPVAGYDSSASAIRYARDRFKEEGLQGDFYEADFASMELGEKSADIVIDRAALTCARLPLIQSSIEKVYQAIKPEGLFLFTPYAVSSYASADRPVPDDRFYSDIEKGGSSGYGGLSYLSQTDILSLFDERWSFEQMILNRQDDCLNQLAHWHDEWQVIVRKVRS